MDHDEDAEICGVLSEYEFGRGGVSWALRAVALLESAVVQRPDLLPVLQAVRDYPALNARFERVRLGPSGQDPEVFRREAEELLSEMEAAQSVIEDFCRDQPPVEPSWSPLPELPTTASEGPLPRPSREQFDLWARLMPLTYIYVFIQAPLEQVRDFLVDGGSSRRRTVTPIQGAFEQSLRLLQPLRMVTPDKTLLGRTTSGWTALFTNVVSGTDESAARISSSRLGVRSVLVARSRGESAVGRTFASTRVLTLYEEGVTRRSLYYHPDEGSHGSGTPLPFERLDYLHRPKPAGRFPHELLVHYCERLGLPLGPTGYTGEWLLISDLERPEWADDAALYLPDEVTEPEDDKD